MRSYAKEDFRGWSPTPRAKRLIPSWRGNHSSDRSIIKALFPYNLTLSLNVECRYLAIQSESSLRTTSHNGDAYPSTKKPTFSVPLAISPPAISRPTIGVRWSFDSLITPGICSPTPLHTILERFYVSSSLAIGISFLIHNLRLNYLRSVEDPYGPRLISLSPSYTSNPYILASNLVDVERWPELTVTSSPAPSDDENERGLGLDGGSPPGAPQQSSSGLANLNHHHERNGHDGVTDGDGRRGRPTGFPGATGLKYTTTIMGANRSGTMGLRVSGGGGEKRGDARKAARRASARFERRRLSDGMGVGGRLEEASVLEASDEDREGSRNDGSEESRAGPVGVNIIGPSDGGEASIIPKLTPPPPDVGAISGEVVNHHGGSGLNLPTSSSPPHHKYSPSQDQTQATGALLKTISSSSAGSTSGAATATPPKAVGFIPNFKGAAEMEARRRLRLQARGRGGPGGLGVGTRGGAQPTQPLSLRDIDTSSSSSSEPEPPSDVEGDKAHTSDEDTSGHLPADSYSDVLAAGEDSAEEDGFDSAPVIDGSMDLAHEFDPYVPLPLFLFISRPVSFSFHFAHGLEGFTLTSPVFGLGSFLRRVGASTSGAGPILPRCCRCLIR